MEEFDGVHQVTAFLIRLRLKGTNLFVGKEDSTYATNAAAKRELKDIDVDTFWWVKENRAKVWTSLRDLKSNLRRAFNREKRYSPEKGEELRLRQEANLEVVSADGSIRTISELILAMEGEAGLKKWEHGK